MRTGLDSAYPPTPAQIAAAKAAGYTSWSGYFAGTNILNGWADSDFQNVLNGGMETSAYCSGWADPAAMKARAAALGIVGILDDESGIRSLGMEPSSNRVRARYMMHGGYARPTLEFVNGLWRVSAWVQPWLDASGFGQYGNQPVFAGVHASRYVIAAYPGSDPGASWPSYQPRPADGNPCGWQFQGTTTVVGHSADLTHYDDSFWAFGPAPGNLTEDDMLYTDPFHPLPATLKTFAAMTVYSDPSPNALVVGTIASGASYAVKGFLYSSSGVQSSDRGAGAGPGIDLVWWQDNNGNWAPDADLITVGVAGAPVGAVLSALPAGAKLYYAKESELAGLSGGGVTMAQVDAEIAAKAPVPLTPGQINTAITLALQGVALNPTQLAQVTSAINTALAALPASGGLTKDEVDAEILTALGNFKPTEALPTPHHHGVLGIINTGPVISD
jgi:hypothetical protein